MEVHDSVILTGEHLKPLFRLIGGLLCTVDDKVQMQQAAGTTRVGYNTFYDHIMEEKNGYADFSGSHSDKKFCTHEHHDMEKEIMRRKSYQKSLATVSTQSSVLGSSSSTRD